MIAMETNKMKSKIAALLILSAVALPTAAQEKSFEEMAGDVDKTIKEMPKPRLAAGLETAAWVSLGNISLPQESNAPFGDKGVELTVEQLGKFTKDPRSFAREIDLKLQADGEDKLKTRRAGASWDAFESYRIMSWIDENYHQAPLRLQEYLDALKKVRTSGEGPWTARIDEEIAKVDGFLKQQAQEDLKSSAHQRYHERRLKLGKDLGLLDENGNPISAMQRIARDIEKLQEKTRQVLEEQQRR